MTEERERPEWKPQDQCDRRSERARNSPASHWVRIRAAPQLCGPASVGTVEAIKVLRDELCLGLAEAKSIIDTAVFDGQTARVLIDGQPRAERLARGIRNTAPAVFTTWVEEQQRVDDLLLLIPHKKDVERDAVASAWELAGGSVLRLDRFWEPPQLNRERVRLYGPDTFALIVAQKLGLELAEPDQYVVAHCPPNLLGRSVSVDRLDNAAQLDYPRFVKSIVPKQFQAGVYGDHPELLAATHGLESSTEILSSDVVHIEAEMRSFVLDGVVKTCGFYEGEGDFARGAKTCELVANALELPRAVVIDVGRTREGSWVFIEANAAWGAGLNGCDPHAVLSCIASATTPAS